MCNLIVKKVVLKTVFNPNNTEYVHRIICDTEIMLQTK